MWNSNIPRAIQLVEEFVKLKGALPMVQNPKGLVKALGDGRDEDNGLVWHLKEKKKQKSCLLLNTFQLNQRILSLLVKIQPSKKSDGDDETDEQEEEEEDDEERKEIESNKTPILTSRTLALSNASTTKGAAIQASKSSRQLNDHLRNELNVFDSNIPKSSSTNTFSGRRSTSISSFTSANGRTDSPLITPTPSIIRSKPVQNQAARDKKHSLDVLLEAEVELKHYPNGYEIVVASEILSLSYSRIQTKKSSNDIDSHSSHGDDGRKGSIDMSDTVSIRSVDTTASAKTSASTSTRGYVRSRLLPLEGAAEGRNDLPIIVSAHDLPPSAVLAATLAPNSRPRKHLIRLSLPENAFSAPRIDQEDKMSVQINEANHQADEPDGAKTRQKGSEDDWRSPLIERGALLRLIVKPISGPVDITSPKDRQGNDDMADEDDDDEENGLPIPVRYEGERLNVMHVNKTSAMLQRESGGTDECAVLKR